MWENIVTACYGCNSRKAGRTPAQAGMVLRKKPVKPRTLPLTTPVWPADKVPDLWRPYLDAPGSGWAFHEVKAPAVEVA